MTSQYPTRLTVLFDGGCPLCSREISHYRQLAPVGEVEWIDVTREADRLVCFGVTSQAAMQTFHVLDRDGHLHLGVRGFLVLWEALPYYRQLARLCRFLHVIPLLEWGYARFARWHYRRRCSTTACG